MSTSYETILVETHGHVGLVRINRPKVRNALNSTVLHELNDALEIFDNDPAIGAMVITGDDQAFAAGADIKEMTDATSMHMLEARTVRGYLRYGRRGRPGSAAASGWCLGGGNELAMTCDMIVASETARFGQPEINLGVIPGAGGTQRLTHAVGKAIAMEMVLNNRILTAEEARNFGLVNRVVPVERYLDEALQLAEEIAVRAPLAVRLGKEAINHAYESFLSDGLADERRSFYLLFASQDQKEGMQAFVEKRKAVWKGE
jgi:enoyl-CoA hydratase